MVLKSLKAALAAASFLVVASVAHAQIHSPVLEALSANTPVDDAAFKAFVESSPGTLEDFVTPDEIAQELDLPMTAPVMTRFGGGYTDRLFILVNKAQRGTSPTAQTMHVYLDGQLLYTWKVSTGREKPEIAKSGRQYFSATPTGTFRIQRRVKDYVSGTWQAPMPFAQFLIGGIAIHATTASHYAALGSRDSGGCVRLRYENAQTIWNLVSQVGSQNVKVQIVNQAN